MALASIAPTNIKNLFHFIYAHPVIYHLRYKRNRVRKPTYLPMAPSKIFRIPVHPKFPQDEQELNALLLEEYYRKIDSLRIVFKEEFNAKSKQQQVKEDFEKEEDFLALLEENRIENERVKAIREETMERLFQEEQLKLMELHEQRQIEMQKKNKEVEEIVRGVKENRNFYLSYENLEAAVERAIDNPVNYNFAISVNGEIFWEGTPPKDFEERIMKNVPSPKDFEERKRKNALKSAHF